MAKVTKEPGKKTKPETAQPGRIDKMAAALGALGKVLKDDPDMVIKVNPALLKESIPHLPTGSIILDHLIGGKPNAFGVSPCPGFPKGKIINIYGHESSGKTTMALTAAAETCRNGGQVVYVDWEHELSLDYAKAIGVPVEDASKFLLIQPNTLEAGMKVLWTMANAGVDLLVIDSIGAGVPEDVFNQSIDDQGGMGRIGLMAAKWSSFLPKFKVVLSRTGSTCLGIAQTRTKIQTGGYGGDGVEVQGGKAWKFYSALRILLRRVKSEKSNEYDAISHKKEEQVYGGVIKAKLDKCKVSASALHEAEYYIRWGEGIDDVRSIIEIAAAHGIIKKSGSWYAWERPSGEAMKFQGTEGLRSALLKDSKAWNELKGLTMDKLGGSNEGLVQVDEDEEDEDEDLSFIDGPKGKGLSAIDDDDDMPDL